MSFKRKIKWSFVTMLLFVLLSISQVFAAHWTKLNHDWYHFNDKNEMEISKWVKWNDRWYHVGTDGKMQRGWYNEPLTNYTYYFDNKEDTGHAYKWVQPVETNYYYFDGNNRLVKYDASTNNSGSGSGKQKINNSEFFVDEFGRVVRADGSVIKTSDSDAPKAGDSLGAPPTVSDDIVVRPEAGKGGSSGGGGGSSGGSSGGGSSPTPTPTPPGPTPPPANCFTLPALYVGSGYSDDGTRVKNVIGSATSIEIKFLSSVDLNAAQYASWIDLDPDGDSNNCKVGMDGTTLTFATDAQGFKYPNIANFGDGDCVPFYTVIATSGKMNKTITSLDMTNTYLNDDNSMEGMFLNCKIDSVDFTPFYTSSCTSYKKMFNQSTVQTVNATNLIKSTATDVSFMFQKCTNLTSVTGINTWDTSNCDNFSNMFDGCNQLTSIDMSSLKVGDNANFYRAFMFNSAITLIKLPGSGNTKVCTNIQDLCDNCSNLTTIDFGVLDISSANVSGAFSHCSNINYVWTTSDGFDNLWNAADHAHLRKKNMFDSSSAGWNTYNQVGSGPKYKYCRDTLTSAMPPLGASLLCLDMEEPEEDEATPSDIPRTSLFGLPQVNNENEELENESEEDIVASPSDITAVTDENTEEHEENNDNEEEQEENNDVNEQGENNAVSEPEVNKIPNEQEESNASNEPVENNTPNEPKENNDNEVDDTEESPKDEESSTQNEGN